MTHTPLPTPEQQTIGVGGVAMLISARRDALPKAQRLIWGEFAQSRKRRFGWETHLPWVVHWRNHARQYHRRFAVTEGRRFARHTRYQAPPRRHLSNDRSYVRRAKPWKLRSQPRDTKFRGADKDAFSGHAPRTSRPIPCPGLNL